MNGLVSTEWLENELGAPDLSIVNASKHLEEERRDPAAEHRAGHIPGATFLDLDAIGSLPGDADFAHALSAIGVARDHRIILYDDSPLHSAARAWWLLRMFGARDVAILDGGLAKWTAERRPLERGETERPAARFAARRDDQALRTKADVLAIVARGGAQIVDARSPARFAGVAPEPRRGVAPGHIPGARNVPQSSLFHDDGTWKRDVTLRAAFENAGVEVERPVVTTCGSGVTAAVLAFGLHLLGRPDAGLYNGSWAEWGSDPATPKALGAHG